MRQAFEEVTNSLDEQSAMPPNPGPVYLLINALAITVATYVFSFRMLNVRGVLNILATVSFYVLEYGADVFYD